LDDAIRNLFTVSDGLKAWFERIQRHRHWGPVVVGLSVSFRIVVASQFRRASPWISRIRYRTPG
jgi:hypothetical protein